jgi:hypothetical protein
VPNMPNMPNMPNTNKSRISVVAFTIAALVMWALVERTFMAITEGLQAAVEVSQVSAEAAGSVSELSKNISTLIGSVDQLSGNAQALAVDSSKSADSVAKAANGSVGDALQASGKTAERLAPIVAFVENLTGSKGSAQELKNLSRSLQPLPKELDGIAANLEATSKSLSKTGDSLGTVRIELKATKSSVDNGRVALDQLPGAARKAEVAASGPLKRLRFNLWLWRLAILGFWIAGIAALIRRTRQV